MTDPTKQYTPPGKVVTWVLVHRDGTCKETKAMTAFFAAQSVGWGLSDLVSCEIKEEDKPHKRKSRTISGPGEGRKSLGDGKYEED